MLRRSSQDRPIRNHGCWRFNGASVPRKLREQECAKPIGRGESSESKTAKSAMAFQCELLLLAGLADVQQFPHLSEFLWLVLLTLFVVGAIWIGLAALTDHLVRQGRYDLALWLVPLSSFGGGRSYALGYVLKEAARYDEAERILREIINHTGSAKANVILALEDLGDVLLDTGRFEEAQRCFQSAADLRTKRSVWANGMAEVLLRQGIYPQNALRHATTALNLFQHGTERIGSRSRLGAILATQAWALAACGRAAEARKTIDVALKTGARKTRGPLAQIHYKAGMSLVALSEVRGAVEHFACGAEIDPLGRWGRLCSAARDQQRT